MQLFPRTAVLVGVCFALVSVSLYALPVSAHEAYVLTTEQFQEGLGQTGIYAFDALKNPNNVYTFTIVTVAILALLIANMIFRESHLGMKMDRGLRRLSRIGPVVVRIVVALSFFFSAWSWSFMGPELALGDLPFALVIRTLLFAISAMLLFGIGTEIAALAAVAIFSIAAVHYGWYIVTYFTYIGEIVVLVLFGSRMFSLDGFLFGATKRFPLLQKYETTIVRIFYGMALSFSAIFIKFLHPMVTETVVRNYDLTQFYWLFPQDPLLVVLGAALAELAIGIFIIVGFEVRLAAVVSMVYLTLSLLYFRELIWPHLILYGISLDLLFSSEEFSVDNTLIKHKVVRLAESGVARFFHRLMRGGRRVLSENM
ncbi:hypothetical protein L0Y40_00310 [Candidatus Wolfebacteria bacterium]|nr:hypothetical protein [Candidatus Wolfebacteria bacterium]